MMIEHVFAAIGLITVVLFILGCVAVNGAADRLDDDLETNRQDDIKVYWVEDEKE